MAIDKIYSRPIDYHIRINPYLHEEAGKLGSLSKVTPTLI